MTYEPKYTDELKCRIVAEINNPEDQRSIAEVARTHELSDGTLHGWLKDQRYNPEGYKDRIANKRPYRKKKKKKKKKKKRNGAADHVDLLVDLDSGQSEIHVPAKIHDEGEVQELRDKVAELEKEVAFLRKTAIYFARQAPEGVE